MRLGCQAKANSVSTGVVAAAMLIYPETLLKRDRRSAGGAKYKKLEE